MLETVLQIKIVTRSGAAKTSNIGPNPPEASICSKTASRASADSHSPISTTFCYGFGVTAIDACPMRT